MGGGVLLRVDQRSEGQTHGEVQGDHAWLGGSPGVEETFREGVQELVLMVDVDIVEKLVNNDSGHVRKKW